MKDTDNRTIRVTIRFSKADYEKIKKRYENSTCLRLATHLRQILLGKKISLRYRNQSIDDQMKELTKLRRELNQIGLNFNQAVRKLNSCAETEMPKAHHWQNMLNISKNELEPCIREIKDKINIFADVWYEFLRKEKI
ncbi:MAG: hypothetical protein MUC49_22630 [Raineya sp.]|jgi:hypothetical protein|nr:hypothetical protein [Raineya sp.]